MFDPNNPEIKKYVNRKLKKQAMWSAGRILDVICPQSYADVEECTGLSREDMDRVLGISDSKEEDADQTDTIEQVTPDFNTPEGKQYVEQKLKEQAEWIAEKILDVYHPRLNLYAAECTGLSREDMDRIIAKRGFREHYREEWLLFHILELYMAIKNPKTGISLDQVIERAHIDRNRLDLEVWKAEPEKWAVTELRCEDVLPFRITEEFDFEWYEYYRYNLGHKEFGRYQGRRIFPEIPVDKEEIEKAYQKYITAGRNDERQWIMEEIARMNGIEEKHSSMIDTYRKCLTRKAWYEEGCRESKRTVALVMCDFGESIEEICGVAHVSEETVTGWLREAGKIAD